MDHLSGLETAAAVQAHGAAHLEEYGEAASQAHRACATLGGKGTRPCHFERDFQRLVVDPEEVCITPDPHFVDLTVRRTDKLGVRTIRHPVLLPHDWLGCLHLAGDMVFRTVLLGPEGTLEEYWRHEADRPDEWKHPRCHSGQTTQA